MNKTEKIQQAEKQPLRKQSFGIRFKKDFRRNYGAYLLFLPVALYYILFAYKPMYGILVAFKDFTPARGVWESPWTSDYGFGHFISFFESFYFIRVLKNTLVISFSTLLVTFPAPIILALLLNEVRSTKFKRTIQTLSYMPHFISLVVICSMLRLFVADKGIVTSFLKTFGIVDGTYSLLSMESFFVPIYVFSGLWQTVGWNAIIYMSALSSKSGA